MLNYSENHEHLYTLEIYPLYNNMVLYKLYYSYFIADVLLHKKSVIESNHLSESLAAIIGSRWRSFASSLSFTSEDIRSIKRETRGAEPTSVVQNFCNSSKIDDLWSVAFDVVNEKLWMTYRPLSDFPQRQALLWDCWKILWLYSSLQSI